MAKEIEGLESEIQSLFSDDGYGSEADAHERKCKCSCNSVNILRKILEKQIQKRLKSEVELHVFKKEFLDCKKDYQKQLTEKSEELQVAQNELKQVKDEFDSYKKSVEAPATPAPKWFKCK